MLASKRQIKAAPELSVVGGPKIPLKYFQDKEFLKELDFSCRIHLHESLENLSTLNDEKFTVSFGGVTYVTSYLLIIRRLTRTKGISPLQAKEGLIELLGRKNPERVLPLELLDDKVFLNELARACSTNLLTRIEDMAATDERKFPVVWDGIEYQVTYRAIAARLMKNKELKSELDGKLYLLKQIGKTPVISIPNSLLGSEDFIIMLCKKLQKVTGKKIGDIPVSDRTSIEIVCDDGTTYETSFRALVNMIKYQKAKSCQRVTTANAKRYLKLIMEGEPAEYAWGIAMGLNVFKPLAESIVPNRLFENPQFLRRFEQSIMDRNRMTFESVSSTDTRLATVDWKNRKYHVSPFTVFKTIERSKQINNALERFYTNGGGEKLRSLMARGYLIEQAGENKVPHAALGEADLWLNVIAAAEKSLKMKIELANFNLHMAPDKAIEFTWRGKTYKESVFSLLHRRLYYNRNSLTLKFEWEEVLKEAGRSYETTFPRSYIDDRSFVIALEKAFQEQRKTSMQDLRFDDTKKVLVEFNGERYVTTFNNLLQIVAENRGRARWLPDDAEYLLRKIERSHDAYKAIPATLLTNRFFVMALDGEYRKRFGKGIERIGYRNTGKVRIRWGAAEFVDNLFNITLTLSAHGKVGQAEAKERLLKTLNRKNNRELPIGLLGDKSFVETLNRACLEQLHKPLSALMLTDYSLIKVNWKRDTYYVSFHGLLSRIRFNNLGLTLDAAKNYLMLILTGKTNEEALETIRINDTEDSLLDGNFDRVNEFNLESEVIPVLGQNPALLRRWLTILHPEMNDEEVNSLTITSFKGLMHGVQDAEERYLRFPERLKQPKFKRVPPETAQNSITISGKAFGATHVYVAGAWNRRKQVDKDGRFEITVPLKIGEANRLKVFTIDIKNKYRSIEAYASIKQTGHSDETEAFIELLQKHKMGLLESIKGDEKLQQILTELIEQLLIRRFSHSFGEGERYTKQFIKSQKSEKMRFLMRNVLKNFQEINRMRFDNIVEGERLYFFQKYSVELIRRAVRKGAPGIVLASEPGLGKTLVSLTAINGHPSIIITPDPVVGEWRDQAYRFLEKPDVLNLRREKNTSGAEKKEMLLQETLKAERRGAHGKKVLINLAFMRDSEDKERIEIMNRYLAKDGSVLVLDEGHWANNIQTNQSISMSKLKPHFKIVVTATPFKNPDAFRKMMTHITPGSRYLRDPMAWRRSFSKADGSDLRVLYLWGNPHLVRFKKRDVFEEYDPKKPLDAQKDRLPKKLQMPERHYTLTASQSEAIFEMFMDWKAWTIKYGHYIPNDQESVRDGVWTNDGTLSKRHALRHAQNNPEYIGSKEGSDKQKVMARTVNECLAENRKVIIFTRYLRQAEIYEKMFKNHNPAIFTGKVAENGDVCHPNGDVIRFRKGERDFIYDEKGYPIPDKDGEAMTSLEYEKKTFMNAPDRKIVICTMNTGGAGVTLNAAKAVIFDDLPEDYVQQYQAEDRAHRIDTDRTRTHYNVKYYKLISQYPEDFIRRMKKIWVAKEQTEDSYRYVIVTDRDYAKERELPTAYEKFFEQGTFDQALNRNLAKMKMVFNLIIDGIADESVEKEFEHNSIEEFFNKKEADPRAQAGNGVTLRR